MGYIEQFASVLVSASHSREYHEALSEWVFDGESFENPSFCICKHDIVQNMVVHNDVNGNTLLIGNCCIKKFGVARKHYNKSPSSYLLYTLRRVSSDDSSLFVKSLIGKLERYGSLKMSVKDKYRLEKLSGKRYRWNCKWNWRR